MKPVYPGNNIPGWMSNDELQWLFETARLMCSVLEIGSWYGRSTHAILSGCRGPVYAVDTFRGTPNEPLCEVAKLGNVRAELERNCGDFPNLIILQADSRDAVRRFNDRSFDMIFIDGDHRYEMVLHDIRAWKPKARRLLCGHDANFYGLPRALAEVGVPWKQEVGSIWSMDPEAVPVATSGGDIGLTVEAHMEEARATPGPKVPDHIQSITPGDGLGWLAEAAQGMTSIVEVGSYYGSSTWVLCTACPEATIYAVDHWQGSPDPGDHTYRMAEKDDVYARFVQNVGHFPNLHILKMDSVDAAARFPRRSIDMVFLDAGHDERSVRADVAAWFPICRKLFCGHDWNHEPVATAVQTLGLPVQTHPGNMWSIRC